MRAMQNFKQQKGAAAVLGAAALLAALIAFAVTIDIARLYNDKKDLQRLANLAALDAARDASQCYAQGDPNLLARTEVLESIARNGGQSSFAASDTAVQLGQIEIQEGINTFVLSDIDEAETVRVSLQRPFPQRILPFLGDSSGTMFAVATAEFAPRVQLQVRSTLANVEPEILNAALGPLLGGAIDISVAGFEGLADATLPLGVLAIELGVATPEELLALSDLETDTVLDALAAGLGDVTAVANDAALEAINQLADAAAIGETNLADLLGLSAENGGPDLESPVAVGPVIQALAQTAAGDSAIDLSGIGDAVNLPGNILDLDVTMRVINPPQGGNQLVKAGQNSSGDYPSETSNAQAVIGLNIAVNTPAILQALFPDLAINLPIFVEAGQARAYAEKIDCGAGTDPHTVDVRYETNIARIGLGEYDFSGDTPVFQNSATINIGRLQLGGIPLLGSVPIADVGGLALSASAEMGSEEENQITMEWNPNEDNIEVIGEPTADAVANGLSDLADSLSIEFTGDIDVLGIGLFDIPIVGGIVEGLVNNAISTLVSTLLTTVVDVILTAGLSDLINSLLEGLGLTLGSAELDLIEVDVEQPRLMTH